MEFLYRLSTSRAMGIYLLILMLLVAALTAIVLFSLHIIRSSADAAAAELGDGNGKKRKRGGASRFSNLSRIDQLPPEETLDYGFYGLKTICRDFRNFAANKLGLYYELADIRRFIAGMGMSRLIILQGISGTGKTSLAYAAGEFFCNSSTIVPIQPMWKERSDLLGYFNEFTRRFNETPLLCKLYEAGRSKKVYITVLDEVNIARIEYYFAEFLSLLEIPDPKKRKLDVVSDSWKNDPVHLEGGKLQLPENMWFVGTSNHDDSTFSISDKVYDRAAVLDLNSRCQSFSAPETEPVPVTFVKLQQLFDSAKKVNRLSDFARENIRQLDLFLTEQFRISFGNRIMRQIEEYVPIMIACGGTEEGALDDIFARKIFRKLEQLSPVLIRNQVPALVELLQRQYGENTLSQSIAYLQRLEKSV